MWKCGECVASKTKNWLKKINKYDMRELHFGNLAMWR